MYVMKIEPPPTRAPSVTCRCHGRLVSGASASPRLVITMPIGITTRGPQRSIAIPRNGTYAVATRKATENAPAVTARSQPNSARIGGNSSENAVRVFTPMPIVTKATATTIQP